MVALELAAARVRLQASGQTAQADGQMLLKQIATLWWTPLDYEAEDFDFADLASLTARIEANTAEFVAHIESFLSEHDGV